MRLPFGLDFVSVVVGVLFAMFVLPWILGLFARRSGSNAPAK